MYLKFFNNYNASPLLIVNAEDIDFVNNESDYKNLLEKIYSIIEGSKINLLMLDRYLKKNLENYKLPELVNIKKFKLNKNGKVDIHHLKKFIGKKYD